MIVLVIFVSIICIIMFIVLKRKKRIDKIIKKDRELFRQLARSRVIIGLVRAGKTIEEAQKSADEFIENL